MCASVAPPAVPPQGQVFPFECFKVLLFADKGLGPAQGSVAFGLFTLCQPLKGLPYERGQVAPCDQRHGNQAVALKHSQGDSVM